MGYTLIQTGYVADYGSIGSTPQERRRCHACCDPGCAEPYPVCSLIADNKEETIESLRLEFHKEFHLLPMGYLDGDTGQLYRYSSDETRCSGSLEKCYRYSAPPDLPEDEARSAVSQTAGQGGVHVLRSARVTEEVQRMNLVEAERFQEQRIALQDKPKTKQEYDFSKQPDTVLETREKETPAQERAREEAHEKKFTDATAFWRKCADKKDWTQVKASMDV